MLEHAFPGLRDAPGGTIIAAAASLADIMGPKERLTTELSLAYSGKLIDEIKALDPSYESEAFPSTFDGQMRHIDNLRWDRATAVYGKTGNAGPLQYETMRFLQKQVDAEYENALEAAGRGELPPAPTRAMAIGNYLDRAVQRALRNQLSNLRAAHRGALPAKVNAREYDTSGEDLTYTRPDARIGNLALDATLSRKTPGSRQIRGFFNSDFAPAAVAIIRTTPLGGSYIITRPGN